MEEQSRALLDRPAVHPEKECLTDPNTQLQARNSVEDGQEVQRIIVESKASGAWGQDAVAPAKAALAAMDRGENVTAPASLQEVIRGNR